MLIPIFTGLYNFFSYMTLGLYFYVSLFASLAVTLIIAKSRNQFKLIAPTVILIVILNVIVLGLFSMFNTQVVNLFNNSIANFGIGYRLFMIILIAIISLCNILVILAVVEKLSLWGIRLAAKQGFNPSEDEEAQNLLEKANNTKFAAWFIK